MPKATAPYNEEGINLMKKIKPDVENIGGEVDFGGNVPTDDVPTDDIPVANAQDRMAGGGDIEAYYAIGGEINKPKVGYKKGVQKGQKTASERQAELDAKRKARTERLKAKKAAKKASKDKVLTGPLAGPEPRGKKDTIAADTNTINKEIDYRGETEEKEIDYRGETEATQEDLDTFAKERKEYKRKNPIKPKKVVKDDSYSAEVGPVKVEVEKEAVEKAKKIAKKTAKTVGKAFLATRPGPIGKGYRAHLATKLAKKGAKKATKLAKKGFKAGKKAIGKKAISYLESLGWSRPEKKK